MAGESQRTPASEPDPTVLTTEAMARAIAAERDWTIGKLEALHERLRGIDKATELLDEQVNRVPNETQRAVGHLRELMDERLRSVEVQFSERDKALAAAFAAQKEAMVQKDESGSKAIAKSETNTKDSIEKLTQLIGAETKAIVASVSAVNERVGRLEIRVTTNDAAKQGGKEQVSAIYAFAAFIVTVIIIGTVLAANGTFSK